MSRITRAPLIDDTNYPTRDGKPMAETDVHLLLMLTLIPMLREFFLPRPRVYVGGNMLVFYERDNKRKHVSPDVFVVPGVPSHLQHLPDNFLIWKEGKAPQAVVELTSKTTSKEDTVTKFALYRDALKVKEYFLFDPRAEYLRPPMQGYRLQREEYVPIKPVEGRLPSRVLGLHLERDGRNLRLWNPTTGHWLLTPQEARHQAEANAERQAEARQLAQAEAQHEAAGRRQAEAGTERLRREIEELRGRKS